MSNLCPACKTPMKPLLFEYFCPNDCDKKKEKTVIIRTANSKWRVIKIAADEELPFWVTRCWHLPYDVDSSKSLEELADRWDDNDRMARPPGWSLSINTRQNIPTLGFGPIEED